MALGWHEPEECSTRGLRVIRKVLAHRTAINTMVGIAVSCYSLAARSLSDHIGRIGADIFSNERPPL
jgi:hypothetical protein